MLRFQLKCSVEEPLDYCWFRSPNGTDYSVSNGGKTINGAIHYAGLGFELGDCTAEVRVANKSDAGQWSCYMGTTSGKELQTTFNVEFKGIY